jgi:hypothetical protein
MAAPHFLSRYTAQIGTAGDCEIIIAEATVAERAPALQLIRQAHYQRGDPPGRILVARIANERCYERLVKAERIDARYGLLLGAAVISSGCTHGSPVGRQHLRDAHFPQLDLAALTRDVVVAKMKLAMLRRVAVAANCRGFGIGEKLALESRRFASRMFPPARFVEVMTTRRLNDAKKLISSEGKIEDFLQNAGFILAPRYTGRSRRLLTAGANYAEDTVRLYYWAPAID